MQIHGVEVEGPVIDGESRCVHYHGEKDRIAIRFRCCGRWFPCHACHEESGCGHHAVWPSDRFGEEAVLCGSCGRRMTVRGYLEGDSSCPGCGASFNAGCKLHRRLYFE